MKGEELTERLREALLDEVVWLSGRRARGRERAPKAAGASVDLIGMRP